MAKAISFSAVAGDGQRDKVWASCATVQCNAWQKAALLPEICADLLLTATETIAAIGVDSRRVSVDVSGI